MPSTVRRQPGRVAKKPYDRPVLANVVHTATPVYTAVVVPSKGPIIKVVKMLYNPYPVVFKDQVVGVTMRYKFFKIENHYS